MEASLCNPGLISPSFFSKFYSSSPCSNSNPFSPNRVSALPIPIETVDEEIATNAFSRRRLILLRHAKSSWGDRSLKDHDRPLSKSGRADAVKVSQKTSSTGLDSSAYLIQEELEGFLEAEVHFLSSFYSIAAMDGQTSDHIQKAICEYSRDDVFTVMCMGHNRGWEEAASMFSGSSIELKTCNAALLETTGKSWEEAFALAGLGGWKLQGIVKPN